MTDALAGMVLIVATLAVGLVAAIFGVSANPIMPGLGRTDDRTFVGSFRPLTARSSTRCCVRDPLVRSRAVFCRVAGRAKEFVQVRKAPDDRS